MAEVRTDNELIRFVRTDPLALETLYRRHLPRVVSFGARRCAQPADVADLVASTFLAVLEGADRFDPRRGEVGPWILGIAARQLGTAARGERRQRSLTLMGNGRRSLTVDDVARLDEQMDAVKESGVVEAAVATLKPSHREVFWLVGHDGLDPAGAAQVLGISKGAFRVRLLRARRALAGALGSDSPETPTTIRKDVAPCFKTP